MFWRDAWLNRHLYEDAHYLHLDRKTLWSFSVHWDRLWAFRAQLWWKEKKSSLHGTKQSMRYHSGYTRILTFFRKFLWGIGLPKGNWGMQTFLGPDSDCPFIAKVEGSLTAWPTHWVGMKIGLSDMMVPRGRAIVSMIKIYSRITRWSSPISQINGMVWHVDVTSSSPCFVVCSNSLIVYSLKENVS